MPSTVRSPRARIAGALLAAAALVVAPLSVAPAFAADPVEVDLLTINDFHGRIEAAPPVAGAAQLAGMVQSYEAANPNTILAAAGDLIGASTFTSFIQQDQPTLDALNLAGLDVSCVRQPRVRPRASGCRPRARRGRLALPRRQRL